jgi:hypothetical protein
MHVVAVVKRCGADRGQLSWFGPSQELLHLFVEIAVGVIIINLASWTQHIRCCMKPSVSLRSPVDIQRFHPAKIPE